MPRISQVMRKPRQPKRPKKEGVMFGRPQLSGVCVRVTVTKPKKPNSAFRKIAKVRLSNGKEKTVYIPGEGHNLQEHSSVHIIGKPRNDLPGVSTMIVRGRGDTEGVKDRKRGRSKYGAPKPKA